VTLALLAAGSALYIGHRWGSIAAVVALTAVVLAALLLSSGRFAVGTVLVVGIVAEEDPSWGFKPFASLYNHVPSAFEALEIAAVVAVLLYLVSTREPIRMPRGFSAALSLAALAVLAGVLQGVLTGSAPRSAIVSTLQTIAPLLIIPLLVVNVVRTQEQLRAALAIGLALAGVKAFAGLLVVLSGAASSQIGLGRLTYYQPTANLLMMLFLLAVLVAQLSGTSIPRWVRWLAPVVFATLLLSYRRGIWLGTVLAAALVIFPASGRVGRRLIAPAACVVALAFYLALGTGLAGDLQGTLVNRVTSINVAAVARDKQDRYRIGERKNVWAAIARSPVTGIGIGTEWPTRYPMSFEYAGGHLYAHLGVLWWWMKMGLLGLAAYVLLLGSALATGIRVWRRHADAQVRVFGLTAAAMTAGLLTVELTSSIIGPNERGTLLFGAVIGLLAAANMQLGAQVAGKTPAKLGTQ
jgi:O-antigen ligase